MVIVQQPQQQFHHPPPNRRLIYLSAFSSSCYSRCCWAWCLLWTTLLVFVVVYVFLIVVFTQTQQSQKQNNREKHQTTLLSLRNDFIQTSNKNKKISSLATTTTTITSAAVTDSKQEVLPLFLNYQLYQDRPYNITFGPYTKCPVGITYNKFGRKPIQRVDLSTDLAKHLNIQTYYGQTNLRIVSVGDSVMMQFHQLLEEAVGGGDDNNDNVRTNRKIYHNAWNDHESVSILTVTKNKNNNILDIPASAGTTTTSTTTAVVAGFRMTGLLLHSGKHQPVPNAGPNMKTGAGGWDPQHIQELLNHRYTYATTTTSNNDTATTATTNTTTTVVDKFDVMLFRIPHGWIPLSVITETSIQEAFLLAHELFGVRTIIVHSLFFNNNVKTEQDLQDLQFVNQQLRKLVDRWIHPSITLWLLDFGRLADALIEKNAQRMGMDTTANNRNYVLKRLSCTKFPPSIAQACATIQNRTDNCTCIRNRVSIDGMHWCMESVGGVVLAATACLIQCSLQKGDKAATLPHRDCERHCNQQFLSVTHTVESLVQQQQQWQKPF